ncbi:MAG: ABC transporter permease [Myxococcota bacterium]|nr:ABC transporter permease [Myxococcota bacterium]
MTAYVLKRLLAMVPTFFAISLVLFVIINVVPGEPGKGALHEGSMGNPSAENSAHWRFFKAQFHLDKPILFNTRFLITREDVEAALHTWLDKSGRIPRVKRQAAHRWMEDAGYHTVPHLLAIAQSTKDPDLRYAAVQLLSETAQQQLKYDYGGSLSKTDRAWNKAVLEENKQLSQMVYEPDATHAEQQRVIAAWQAWFDGVQEERCTGGFGRHVAQFFFETRFAKYWWRLMRLDFGVSHLDQQPVLPKILSKLKYSVTLAVPSLGMAYVLAIVLGIVCAVKQHRPVDRAISTTLFLLYSVPSFFAATLLLLFFSTGSDYWHWFPTGGWQSDTNDQLTTMGKIGDVIWHLVLPMTCMTYGALAILSRYMRNGMLDVLDSDYIRAARAKGVPEFQIITRHALKKGMLPIVTLLGTVLPALIGGSVIIEVIFNLPGVGLLTYEAIANRDYNTVLAVELIAAVMTMVGILIADIVTAAIDPRVTLK